MNAKHVLALACAVAMTSGMARATTAEPASGLHKTLATEQISDAYAKEVASSEGISTDEARSLLNVQSHAGDIVQRIRKQHASRLAGIYFEHEPSHRLVVRLTGHDAVRPEFHVFGGDRLDVVYELGADHTFADLNKRFADGYGKLAERAANLQGGYVDERTGEIVLQVLHDEKAGSAADLQQITRNHFGVATRVTTQDEPIVNQAISGSGELDFTPASGPAQCMGGFTVYHAGLSEYGLVTAGHCDSANNLYDYTEAGSGTPTHTLTQVARQFDQNADIGWVTIGTNPADALNRFWNGTIWVNNGVPLPKSSLFVGLSLCAYGRSGAGCGTVSSVAFNPGSICGTNPCNPVYIAVNPAPTTVCNAGDSGMGWFLGARPAGIHKAGGVAGVACVFSSIDDLALLGLQIL